ncbi:MAG: Exonuclease RNase T and DNA polymerase III [Candidatus Nomurabacteria bacterium GW2011_GWB1_37_5]|uniref:Exonuclease RNase T and DNA polymerase III n=1 Tax=Candidatus Nomurabacteria bacterium GW2011_GWB1_37_5 TaxID=1618742 RepID=A0A0G0GWE5_9BACT|nr:MAG: Exonuclease RNase T and DNA polymerase III [Candidatus Nomurabacteria bacterium GW2011_GWB1_37_5]
MSQLKKQNLAFIDVETTGLDPDKHEVIELGCVLISQNWNGNKPEFEVLEEIEFKIKPEHIENAEPVALRINGYDPAAWVFAYDLKQAMEVFGKKTADAIMIGHNVCFDYGFVDKAFKKSGVENKMHYHKLDTISIAFAKLHNGEADKFSLNYLCNFFKVENKKAHSALSDARATYEIYKKLMTM